MSRFRRKKNKHQSSEEIALLKPKEEEPIQVEAVYIAFNPTGPEIIVDLSDSKIEQNKFTRQFCLMIENKNGIPIAGREMGDIPIPDTDYQALVYEFSKPMHPTANEVQVDPRLGNKRAGAIFLIYPRGIHLDKRGIDEIMRRMLTGVAYSEDLTTFYLERIQNRVNDSLKHHITHQSTLLDFETLATCSQIQRKIASVLRKKISGVTETELIRNLQNTHKVTEKESQENLRNLVNRGLIKVQTNPKGERCYTLKFAS